ncbi:MAG TPA: extracellular solute-binding protein [Acidimicrobiales bacterium]|nr:extracellular solute-binding protein [Acidimicrobiales bacterium]
MRMISKIRRVAAVSTAGLAAVGAVALSPVAAHAATSMTITEMDYFSTPGQVAAIASYVRSFEAAHPGVTVKIDHAPFAELDTKLLTDATAGDLPNIIASDNPFVPDMIATGQIVPLSRFKGFSPRGYYKPVIDEGLSGGKYYAMPVAGDNSLALFYNIPMLKAAHLSPPTTWAQLVSDAKALTTSKTYGMALTGEAAEDTTWQWEPFFWSDGGQWSKIDSTAGVQAMTLIHQLVSDGSASKDAVSWSQTPSVTDQFLHKQTAMMINGPWNFPTLNQQGWYYGKQFGVVPIPVRVAGQKVSGPLGGEDWMISKSGSTAQQQMAFQFIEGTQATARAVTFAKTFGYMPARPAVAATFLKTAGPEWKIFVDQTPYMRPRTLGYGVNYPKISQVVWTEIQSVISGSKSPQGALSSAQGQITSILKG